MEVWKDITGWEDLYQVSTEGRVRSLDRVCYAGNGGYRTSKGRILSPGYNKVSGYAYVSFAKNGKQTTYNVHSLVAHAFIGPRPDGMEVRHLDGIPANPSLANLCYGTPVENAADKELHGSVVKGASHHTALTDDQILMVKNAMAVRTTSIRKLAKEIGVNRATIMKVMNGTHWSCSLQ